ncbi:hypothetical protein Cme02nite_76000 [Catellatospora methionotrophica]|uniref:Uncharacterized protein n=1 Tax=Catellatospora methionotrophica TaxID=121620 RepID=A0A8J3LDS4_9ACTN|nr:hypothetical protein Cme02nite_76000 [Catellatospora methionotrophica]
MSYRQCTVIASYAHIANTLITLDATLRLVGCESTAWTGSPTGDIRQLSRYL